MGTKTRLGLANSVELGSDVSIVQCVSERACYEWYGSRAPLSSVIDGVKGQYFIVELGRSQGEYNTIMTVANGKKIRQDTS